METFYLTSLTEEQKVLNSQTRVVFQRWLEARRAREEDRGSMTWVSRDGQDYLARSYYDAYGVRKERLLGPRAKATERLKLDFEERRVRTKRLFDEADADLARQARKNSFFPHWFLEASLASGLRAIDTRPELRDHVRVVGAVAILAFANEVNATYSFIRSYTLEVEALAPLPKHLRLLLQRSGVTIVAGHHAARDGWESEDQLWLKRAKTHEGFVIDSDGYPLRMLTVALLDWVQHCAGLVTDDMGDLKEELAAGARGEVLTDWMDAKGY